LIHVDKADVTIVVVPRDHFSSARESLESIYANTDTPFSLLYIDGGSPRHIAQYLKDAAKKRQFRIIRTEEYLSPNHARNIAVRHIDTRYVVFVDNDVIVAPGWLDALVQCAERTGAASVCPLTYEERQHNREMLHYAGGDARIVVVEENSRIERHMVYGINTRTIAPSAHKTELLEFHACLVCTDAYRAVGGMDEKLLSSRDNLEALRGKRWANLAAPPHRTSL
jgi:GT2 family glycosyltransferase